MEQAIALMLQGGALTLLGYIIWWTTQHGAPSLFTALSGIQAAIQSHRTELEAVKEGLQELREEIRSTRNAG